MKSHLLSTIFFLCCLSCPKAQNNYLPGNIVKISGDTIKGLIDNKEWTKNPLQINFRTSESAASETYRPQDLFSFQIDNHDRYVSKLVNKSLESGTENKAVSRKVFLQALVVGRASLYYYQDDTKIYFFIEKDNKTAELKLIHGLSSDNLISTKEIYKGQLTLYMNDCNPGNINSTAYSNKSLMSLFYKYNQCISPEKEQYIKKIEKITFNSNIMLGASITSMSFDGDSRFTELRIANFNWSPRPVFGFDLEIIIPRNEGRYRFNLELFYKSYSVESHRRVFLSRTVFQNYDIKFTNSYLQYSLLFKYKLGSGRLNTFVDAGFFLSSVLKDENSTDVVKFDLVRIGFYSPESGPAISSFEKLDNGILVGGGLNIGKYSLELRYQLSNGVSGSQNLKSKTKSILLVAKYDL